MSFASSTVSSFSLFLSGEVAACATRALHLIRPSFVAFQECPAPALAKSASASNYANLSRIFVASLDGIFFGGKVAKNLFADLRHVWPTPTWIQQKHSGVFLRKPVFPNRNSIPAVLDARLNVDIAKRVAATVIYARHAILADTSPAFVGMSTGLPYSPPLAQRQIKSYPSAGRVVLVLAICLGMTFCSKRLQQVIRHTCLFLLRLPHSSALLFYRTSASQLNALRLSTIFGVNAFAPKNLPNSLARDAELRANLLQRHALPIHGGHAPIARSNLWLNPAAHAASGAGNLRVTSSGQIRCQSPRSSLRDTFFSDSRSIATASSGPQGLYPYMTLVR